MLIAPSPASVCSALKIPLPGLWSPGPTSSRRQSLSSAESKLLYLRCIPDNILRFSQEAELAPPNGHKHRIAKYMLLHYPSDQMTLTIPPDRPLYCRHKVRRPRA